MVSLYLASRSPRRKQLLLKLIDNFEVIDSDIEEVPMQNETAEDYVLRVTRDKAQVARKSLDEDAVILSADTEVVFQDQIIGKPGDTSQAVEILLKLSGQMHCVYTAVALYQESIHTLINKSNVWFKTLNQEECDDYCKQFNPIDKAGAYGIQDQAAGFITRFEGSYSSVMGLPLDETRRLLVSAGFEVRGEEL